LTGVEIEVPGLSGHVLSAHDFNLLVFDMVIDYIYTDLICIYVFYCLMIVYNLVFV